MNIISRAEAQRLGLKRYYNGDVCSRGHIAERWTNSCRCLECSRAFDRKYYAENVDRLRGKKNYRPHHWQRYRNTILKYRSTPNGWAKMALSRARARARKKGWEFDITQNDLTLPDQCPFFRKKFIMGHRDWNPSIDRIDSSKGYVKGNIQIISAKANQMKSDGTLDDLIDMGRSAHSMKWLSDPCYRSACGGSLLESAGFTLPGNA